MNLERQLLDVAIATATKLHDQNKRLKGMLAAAHSERRKAQRELAQLRDRISDATRPSDKPECQPHHFMPAGSAACYGHGVSDSYGEQAQCCPPTMCEGGRDDDPPGPNQASDDGIKIQTAGGTWTIRREG
jgi:hypothetical protein